ncbi:hypothetical protein V6Z12_A07G141200 [Gossypium hirsutum]
MSLRVRKDKKVAAAVPLRRSPGKLKYISLQKKKPGRCKKGKKKPKKKAPQKIKKSIWKKKRTRAYHSYWLDCLGLSSRYASNSNSVACEICEEWFHGDAYGLNSENKINIIGFRCHVCRKTTPPICPNMVATRADESQMAEMQTGVTT